MRCPPILSFLVALRGAAALAPNSWQKRLDRALLDVDGARTLEARARLLQRALRDPALPKDIAQGIDAVREKGMGKGHPALIDALWPQGTLARDDIAGIQALLKSLPERAEEARDVGAALRRLDGDVLRRTARAASGTAERRQRSIALAQNAFRSTPKSVDLLPLAAVDVVRSGDTTVEIRRLEESVFYSCEMESEEYTIANMGSALIKLTNSILGDNDYDVGSIAAPFIMRGARLYLWKKDGDQPDSESDTESDTGLRSWPACTLASIEFPGICTDGEIERQAKALREALTAEGEGSPWRIGDDSPLVLQYNAPGTLPWRRRNQVAFILERAGEATVEGTSTLGTSESGIADAPHASSGDTATHDAKDSQIGNDDLESGGMEGNTKVATEAQQDFFQL